MPSLMRARMSFSVTKVTRRLFECHTRDDPTPSLVGGFEVSGVSRGSGAFSAVFRSWVWGIFEIA